MTPTKTSQTAANLLREAGETVKTRSAHYGEPDRNLAAIAGYWSVYLEMPLTTADVAAMMSLLKIARLQETIDHADSWIDLAGYAGIGAAVTQAKT